MTLQFVGLGNDKFSFEVNMSYGSIGIDCLRRYFTSDKPVNQAVLTTLLFVGDLEYAEIAKWKCDVDIDLLEEILSKGNVSEIAKLLRGTVGIALPHAVFMKYFNIAILQEPLGKDTLWDAVAAAVDYSQIHDVSIAIPKDVTLQLLAARELEHRIIGLKGCRHSNMEPSRYVGIITTALQASETSEKTGALYELGRLIDSWKAEYPESVSTFLCDALVDFLDVLKGDSDDGIREMAQKRLSEIAVIKRE